MYSEAALFDIFAPECGPYSRAGNICNVYFKMSLRMGKFINKINHSVL